MSIYKDKERGCYVFEFSRRIGGERVRATKALPKTWTRAQADAYDRQESARLYATGSGIEKPERTIFNWLNKVAPSIDISEFVQGRLARPRIDQGLPV